MITIEIEEVAKRKRSHFRRKKDLSAVIDRYGCGSSKAASSVKKHIIGLMFIAAGIAAMGYIKLNGLI